MCYPTLVPIDLIQQQACQLEVALRLQRRSGTRYWMVAAARRELEASIRLQATLEVLREARRADFADFVLARSESQ
jgi:hypothetical protein